ncbi:MAG: IcmT/TraK family protein [Alphaproteobacteria bacterium]|nr:IcmT/TraK family protein [Alphaproteobacteria bacterium]
MDAHWRNTQRVVRFTFLDARSFIGIVFFLVHLRLWVLGMAVVILIIFWIFERFGLSFQSALRAMRCWFWGRNRPANSLRARRRTIDTGSI